MQKCDDTLFSPNKSFLSSKNQIVPNNQKIFKVYKRTVQNTLL